MLLLTPGTRSATSVVPAAVPSLRHSSVPFAGVVATNHARPWKATISVIEAPTSLPGTRSTTSRVPAEVPSLTHSSRPTPSRRATKNTRLPTAVNRLGSEFAAPGLASRRRKVPSSVPSVRHGSRPNASVAAK